MESFLSPTFILQLVIAIGSAGAVYGAIRADLRNLRERIGANEATSKEAHGRIDDILRDAAKAAR